MKHLILAVAIFLSFGFAKDMTQGAIHHNFALYIIDALGSVPTQCDTYAVSDPNTEWMCAYYPQGHDAFITTFEQIVTSPIIQANYAISPATDWQFFNEVDGTVDFYGKGYYFGQTQIIIVYDPSEQGREVFIGVSPAVMSIMVDADSSLNISAPVAHSATPTITGSYNCIDFPTQADAISSFNSSGFSASYDPYNLDADNNGIPCESIGETTGDSDQCPAGEYWVDPYTRSDGVEVRGHCRKKR